MTVFRVFLASICLVSLTACACPRSEDYKGVPYEDDRTAGVGSDENQGYCMQRYLPEFD